MFVLKSTLPAIAFSLASSLSATAAGNIELFESDDGMPLIRPTCKANEQYIYQSWMPPLDQKVTMYDCAKKESFVYTCSQLLMAWSFVNNKSEPHLESNAIHYAKAMQNNCEDEYFPKMKLWQEWKAETRPEAAP